MWEDPIVAEIHRIREAYAARFDYDLEAIVQDIQRQGKESGREIVTLPPGRSLEDVEDNPQPRAQHVGQGR